MLNYLLSGQELFNFTTQTFQVPVMSNGDLVLELHRVRNTSRLGDFLRGLANRLEGHPWSDLFWMYPIPAGHLVVGIAAHCMFAHREPS